MWGVGGHPWTDMVQLRLLVGEQIVKNKKSWHASFVQEDVLLHEGMMMFLKDMVLEFMKKEVSEF